MRFVFKSIRWLLLLTLVLAISLVATLPAPTAVRLIEKQSGTPLPLTFVQGYLWRGSATVAIDQLVAELDWMLCFVAQAPYLGWCWQLQNGDDTLNGELVMAANLQTIYAKNLKGSVGLPTIFASNPQFALANTLGIQGVITSDINTIEIKPQTMIMTAWDGDVNLIDMRLPGMTLPRITINLSTGQLDTNRREHANIGIVPQFELNAGDDTLRIEGRGFITADRLLSAQAVLQTTQPELQQTLRLFARPLAADRFRVAWEGRF